MKLRFPVQPFNYGTIFLCIDETDFLIKKIKVMQRSLMGLLIAAAAAYGYQRFSKMTPEQKTSLKRKGKDLLDKNFSGLRNVFNRKATVEQPEMNAPPY